MSLDRMKKCAKAYECLAQIVDCSLLHYSDYELKLRKQGREWLGPRLTARSNF